MNTHPVLRFIRAQSPAEILGILRKEQIIRRAEQYAREGRVEEIWIDGPALRAHVAGSASSPYHCVLRLHGGELEPECSCPFGRGVCWHVGAVLLTLKAEPERLEALERKLSETPGEGPASPAPGLPAPENKATDQTRKEERATQITMLLSGVAKSRLVDVLGGWAANDPHVEARLLDLVPDATDLDVRLFRQAARAALRPGQWLKRFEIPRVAADVREIAGSLKHLLSGPAPEPVLELFLELAWRVWHRAEESDDQDGVLIHTARDIFYQWLSGWEGIASRDRQKLARELFHWILEDGGGVFRGVVTEAKGVLGPLGLETLSALLRSILAVRLGPSGSAWEEQSLDPLVARVREALRETARVRGDLAEFWSCCDPSGADGRSVLEASAALAREGRFEEALVWAEKGRNRVRGTLREAIEELRLSLLLRLGRRREAIEGAWDMFLAEPGTVSFRRLEQIVGEPDRLEWRRRALEHLEASADAGAFVEVCLDSGDLERLANRTEKAGGFVLAASPTLLEQAGNALFERWPLAAAQILSHSAGRILARGDSRAFPSARQNLEQARAAFLMGGREETWKDWIDRLSHAHAVVRQWFPS